MRVSRQVMMETMMQIQDEVNSSVDVEWRTKNRAWLLAAGMEAAEAIDHLGWKWWKHQEPNMPQVELELTDIWHFLLSFCLTHDIGSLRVLHEYHDVEFDYAAKPGLLTPAMIRYFASSCFAGQLDMRTFFKLLLRSGLTFERLYALYLKKAVLNKFRQANGYKGGMYKKNWRRFAGGSSTTEDNDYLITLNVETMTAEELYRKLTTQYDLELDGGKPIAREV